MKVEPLTVRAGSRDDLTRAAEIQSACLESAHWNVEDYLAHDFLVALCGNRLAGFLVARKVSERENEILNLAVDPEFRSRGVGRGLLQALLLRSVGEIYLEVRESNLAARNIYQILGFQEVGRRLSYYDDPPESAIVMKFYSC